MLYANRPAEYRIESTLDSLPSIRKSDLSRTLTRSSILNGVHKVAQLESAHVKPAVRDSISNSNYGFLSGRNVGLP